MAWYIGFRGTRYVRKAPTEKALALKRWVEATFSVKRPTWIMPSAAHDKQNPRSVHREGRALDIRPTSDAEGWRIAHTIADYPGPGDVQLILWKDFQWGGAHGPVWIHTGRTDHDDHLHVEVRP